MTDTIPVAQLANIHFVTPTLAVGGDLSSRDGTLARSQLAELIDLGVTHVVDVRIEWSDATLFARQAPGIAYLHHGMDDAGQAVPPAWFERAVAWIEAAGPDAVVLAHCHMGINRGPSLGFAVLLSQGWHPVDAIAAIRAARPQANVWYAADALAWHQQRTGAAEVTMRREHAELAAWRNANPLDVVRLIRQERSR